MGDFGSVVAELATILAGDIPVRLAATAAQAARARSMVTDAVEVPDPTEHTAMHTSHLMAGMATPEQMAELAASPCCCQRHSR